MLAVSNVVRPLPHTPSPSPEESLKKVFEQDAASEERLSRRDRRKPKGRRSASELYLDPEQARASAQTFDEPGLQALYERGYLTSIIGELKSGKEATVYLAEGQRGLAAAKVYRDQRVRSFKNDQLYRQGRFIGDERIEKSIAKRSRQGVLAQQALWIAHEYAQLWALQRAGLPAPLPLVGPGPDDIGMAGRVVLMSFIGDEAGAAPRLSDLRLEPEQVASAWRQSLAILARLLALGKIHGDYSSYNLLWWQGRVYVIDFPQMVELRGHPQARALLARDVLSLCTSFRRHGVQADAGEVLREVCALARTLT